jgi:hypothetical protein
MGADPCTVGMSGAFMAKLLENLISKTFSTLAMGVGAFMEKILRRDLRNRKKCALCPENISKMLS